MPAFVLSDLSCGASAAIDSVKRHTRSRVHLPACNQSSTSAADFSVSAARSGNRTNSTLRDWTVPAGGLQSLSVQISKQ
jgi:hypothetical protein